MLINRCIIVLCATVLSFATPAAAQQKQEVMLLTYHLKAPYIVNLGEQKGLYYDLAAYLNSHSQHYQFKTEFMPRKRIDAMLQKPFEHVVVGVQPNWSIPIPHFLPAHAYRHAWKVLFYYLQSGCY